MEQTPTRATAEAGAFMESIPQETLGERIEPRQNDAAAIVPTPEYHRMIQEMAAFQRPSEVLLDHTDDVASAASIIAADPFTNHHSTQR